MAKENNGLVVQSAAFSQNGSIPSRYTCDGEDINPPLEVTNIPEQTKSLALITEDPEAWGSVFDHWLVWNIAPNEAIAEGSTPGISGTNSFGKTGYGGPCPPSGTHRYYFRVYALDIELNLPAGADKRTLLQAMEGHILDRDTLMGTYRKPV